MAEHIRTITSLKHIKADVWDQLANPSGASFNPLVTHAFLSSLEDSGSATQQTGWAAAHLALEDNDEIKGF
jgi:uncharacterized protein